MTGAGFGGCTVSLVRAEAVAQFRRQVPEQYRARTALEATNYVCQAADGAGVVAGP
jgi:galactokinase